MKKIRFFISGSQQEHLFLNKMLEDGYILQKKKIFKYRFTRMDEPINKELIIEYLDQSSYDFEFREDACSDNLLFTTSKTLFAPFYITYSYVDSQYPLTNTNELSTQYKLSYLKYRENQSGNLQIGILFLGIILWFIKELFFKELLGPSFFIQIIGLILLWIISGTYGHFISKKIIQLETRLGKYSIPFTPTLTVAIKNVAAEPDVSSLSYLGKWKFMSKSKKRQEYYYQLYGHLSREEIKAEISFLLQIDSESISISSPSDLIGISF